MPTTNTKITLPRLRLTRKSRQSLLSHIRWFEYLLGDQFQEKFKQSYQRKGFQQKLRKAAIALITESVYDVYEPQTQPPAYVRSNAARNSMQVLPDTSKPVANLVVFSDPKFVGGSITNHNSTGTAKAVDFPDESYLEYFDPDSSRGSFLNRPGAPAIRHTRPFFEKLQTLVADEIETHALDALEKSILFRKPRA